ncbi:MAG TPA: sigma-70 family RNA polymerase sigma factor [Verrucomicrobiales bacterium]|nr:sigma-70 family RNA polymerase sigma factor [Verrucomicrobiales bacterium]
MQSTSPSAPTPAGESDAELLHEYVQLRSETSFAALVTRHSAWVHGVAQRCLSDPDAAREAVQNVFISLGRKATRVNPAALAPWLHRATVLECKNALRREQNRRKALTTLAEQASQGSEEVPAPEPAWKAAEPLLDDALNRLPGRDRTLVLMRYFQRLSWREIGNTLGRSEDAARMAMGPALERLTNLLRRRGVVVPLTALTTLLSEAGNSSVPAATAGFVRETVSTLPPSTTLSWRTGGAAWLGTAACAVFGTLAGYWFMPVTDAAEASPRANRISAGNRQSSSASSRAEAFDLAGLLEELRTLQPSGNDPAKVVRLRAILARMPLGAIPQVLAILRTRQWSGDTRLVASAFFERWGFFEPEAACAAAVSPDFAGTIREATAAVLRGMNPDDLQRVVTVINTFHDGMDSSLVAAGAAVFHLGKLKAADLALHLERIKLPYIRWCLLNHLVWGDSFTSGPDGRPVSLVKLSPEEYAALAPATGKLSSQYGLIASQRLAGGWAKVDESAARAWATSLPERSRHRWGALSGVADIVAAHDPAGAMKLVEGLPWIDDISHHLERVAVRWMSADRPAALAWLETADVPVSVKDKLVGKKKSSR